MFLIPKGSSGWCWLLAGLVGSSVGLGCNNNSQTSVNFVTQPSGSTHSGLVTLSESLDPAFAGEIRFNLSDVQGSLPKSFTIQGATYLLLDDGNQPFYAAEMESLFKPLDPFTQISLPGVESATVSVVRLPVEDPAVEGVAPIFQSNARIVTLRDVGMVLALQQLGGGSPTASQLVSQYATITGVTLPAASINPLPNDSNSDFAAPANTLNLADVAVVQAAFVNFLSDRKPEILAATATQLLKATTVLSASDILLIPAIGSIPTAGSAIVFNPPIAGGDRAGNIEFSIQGSVNLDSFTLGTATYRRKAFQAVPGYTQYGAEQGSELVALSTFNSLDLPGLAATTCVIAHPPNTDPTHLRTQLSRTSGCRDPRALDIVVANVSSNTVSVLTGFGNGTFDAQTTYTSATPRSVTVADLNGDGKLDLIVTNGTSNSIGVRLGNGDGTFQPEVTYSGGSSPTSAGVGDVNGDSRVDVVVADFDGFVSVFLGNGNGTLQPRVSYQVPESPISVAVGDLNGDSQLDLVVADGILSGVFGNYVSVLMGNGDGTFAAQVTYATGFQPYSVVLGDVNHDDRLDVMTANSRTNANSASVLLGNGDGTLQPRVDFPTATSPFTVATGDLNGDGNLDMVLALPISNAVAVLAGNGDGTFQTQVTYATGVLPFSVSLGDVNGDGRLDAVSTNFSSQTISVLLGNGDTTFQPQVTYATDPGPYAVTLGHL